MFILFQVKFFSVLVNHNNPGLNLFPLVILILLYMVQYLKTVEVQLF